VYTTGYFSGTVDFDPDSSGTFNLTSAGDGDVFISKLDGLGNFVWVKGIGGTSLEEGLSIAIDSFGYVHLVGFYYSASISFGTTILVNTDTIPTYYYITSDIFIAKLDNMVTGIESVENTNGISVYPNPANKQFTIALAGHYEKVKVIITDIAGKMIYSTTATTQKIEVNTENFAEGVYAVQIQTADFTEIKKVIVVK
jgi:hypothetical protein